MVFQDHLSAKVVSYMNNVFSAAYCKLLILWKG
jgi:hypothetical protein